MKLLVRMPTRQRPDQAIHALERYRKMSGMPVTIEVVIDEDDKTITGAVWDKFRELDCVVTAGTHRTKIEAVNGGLRDYYDWDVLLLASDDMFPVADNYAVRVCEAMRAHFPYLDGAIYFDDGYAGERCCTLPIMGRRLYQSFGSVYAPEYISLWSDQEQTELLRAMNRITYVPWKLIEHIHPVTKKTNTDELYERNDAFWGTDKATYERRLRTVRPYSQFPFDAPPMWLSICICTLSKRAEMLNRLLERLWRQILAHAPRKVEVVIDGGEGTIGEKRQRLLERSIGHLVCFIDDDDDISDDYISRIIGAIEREPEVDCVSLNGIITTNGGNPKLFLHSRKYLKWAGDGVMSPFVRSPNHLNPVRRTLALETGFQAISHGEDSDYSTRLYPLLKSEADVGDEPIYFYKYVPHK
jgi:hypothetical protein